MRKPILLVALLSLSLAACEPPPGEAVAALGSGGAGSCGCVVDDPTDPFCPATCPTVGASAYAGATASAQFCACGWSAYVCDDMANGGHCTMPDNCYAVRGPQIPAPDGGTVSNGDPTTCGNATAWCCP